MHTEYSANVDYMLKYGDEDDLATYVAIGQMFTHMCVLADNGESIPEVTTYDGPFMATYTPEKDVEAYIMAHVVEVDDERIAYEGGDIGKDSPMATAICGAIVRHLDRFNRDNHFVMHSAGTIRIHPDFDCDYE